MDNETVILPQEPPLPRKNSIPFVLSSKTILSFFLLAILFFGGALSVYLSQQRQTLQERAETPQAIELGFTQQMWATTTSNIHLNDFKRIVDELANHNQKWIRTGIANYEVLSGGSTPTSLNWNDSNLQVYEQALSYAKSKGLKVIVVSGFTGYGPFKTLSRSDFNTATGNYFTHLAGRYGKYIDVWQISNEVNTGDYQTGARLEPSNYPANYLSDLNTMLGVARNAIRTVVPGAQIMVTSDDSSSNAYPYVPAFYSAIKNNIDIIGLDIYPGNTPSLITQRAAQMHNQFGKPVYVTETGQPTGGTSSEAIQAQYIPTYIVALKQSVAQVGLVYEYEDVSNFGSPTSWEGSFGIEKGDGSPKSGYTAIMTAMGGYPTATPVPSVTPSPTPRPTVTPGSPTATPTKTSLVGDINNDGKVDILDYNILANCFGVSVSSPTDKCTYPQNADLNHDLIINGIDYNILLRALIRVN